MNDKKNVQNYFITKQGEKNGKQTIDTFLARVISNSKNSNLIIEFGLENMCIVEKKEKVGVKKHKIPIIALKMTTKKQHSNKKIVNKNFERE